MLPAPIQIDQATLTDFCRSNGVSKLSLFGSALRRDFKPGQSDLDLLVEFSPGESRSLFKLLRMQAQLTELLKRQVDLTTVGSLSKYFRDDVLAEAAVLYDAA